MTAAYYCASISFLSAVENGKKKMPSAWNDKICRLYDLDYQQRQNFTSAIANTEKAIEINLTNAGLERKELAISFAHQFSSINETDAEIIRRILQGVKS